MSWSPLTLAAPTSNSAALTAGLTLLTVDPWTHGVAAGDGSNTHLSFPNAAATLAAKLTGITGAGLAIGLSSSSPSGLATELNNFAAAFPMPNLERIARRAVKMAALEASKYFLKPAAAQAAAVAINALPSLRALQRADVIKAAFDAAEAFKSSSANTNLTDFAGERAAHAAMVATIQADAGAGLTGGNGWRFYAPNNIASAILTGHPGHDHTYTSIMLFVGSVADVSILTEIFPPPPP